MDTLTRQLDNVAHAMQEVSVDEIPQIPMIAAAVRGTHPVIAAVLESSDEPDVARLRAFAVADGVLRSYDGREREVVADVLAHAGIADSRSFARAA